MAQGYALSLLGLAFDRPSRIANIEANLLLFERGRIRTYVETSTDLQSAAFNHSATLPMSLCSALLISQFGFHPFRQV